ncbi:hypothetical protein CDIK_2603 [Cucumispora dikerogammari]|nr:hypothetical protein CDIK_2603 [Cucumispora dikerogammari]
MYRFNSCSLTCKYVFLLLDWSVSVFLIFSLLKRLLIWVNKNLYKSEINRRLKYSSFVSEMFFFNANWPWKYWCFVCRWVLVYPSRSLFKGRIKLSFNKIPGMVSFEVSSKSLVSNI